jgi:hypothetical protein
MYGIEILTSKKYTLMWDKEAVARSESMIQDVLTQVKSSGARIIAFSGYDVEIGLHEGGTGNGDGGQRVAIRVGRQRWVGHHLQRYPWKEKIMDCGSNGGMLSRNSPLSSLHSMSDSEARNGHHDGLNSLVHYPDVSRDTVL